MGALILVVYVLAGLGLVGLSARLRFGTTTLDEATNDGWRFVFFIVWTLSLPLLWFWEWWGVEWSGFGGLAWKHPDARGPMPELAYGRKVVSDVWTAVAVVLAALAWNKKPERADMTTKASGRRDDRAQR